MTSIEKQHALAVSVIAEPSSYNIWDLLHTEGPEHIFELCAFRRVAKTQDFIAHKYSDRPLEAAKRIQDTAARKSISVITFWDDEYPVLLREISRPPIVLYARGTFPTGTPVAIVGTRRSDKRSEGQARRIAASLVALGFPVVSGMAVGIDREAHQGTLDAGGSTIGVMANGIDITYPAANRDLYRCIELSPLSALVSEYPPGIRAGKWTFVRRNRIISGLCAGTVVIKAGARSGALITARYALEQNREVFVCCGNSFDSDYAGCHRLIQDGAVLISDMRDILEELTRIKGSSARRVKRKEGAVQKLPGPEKESRHFLPKFGQTGDTILNLLYNDDYNVDAIIRETGKPPAEIQEAIIELELAGVIMRNGNTLSRVF